MKQSAQSRTISLFAVTEKPIPGPVEQEEVTVKEDVAEPLEVSADRWRDQALQVQEWLSDHFKSPTEPGSEFRMSFKGGRYYLEKLDSSNGKSFYGYTGLVIEPNDLEKIARVIVDAVKARKASK